MTISAVEVNLAEAAAEGAALGAVTVVDETDPGPGAQPLPMLLARATTGALTIVGSGDGQYFLVGPPGTEVTCLSRTSVVLEIDEDLSRVIVQRAAAAAASEPPPRPPAGRSTLGSALEPARRDGLTSWLPGDSERSDGLGEEQATLWTTYEPPHPFALTPGEVDAIVAQGDQLSLEEPGRDTGPGAWECIATPLKRKIVNALDAANLGWWGLGITNVTANLIRYSVGGEFLEHPDMFPGSWQRKVSMTIQLSDPGDYDGGEFVLRAWHNLHRAPQTRGTIVAFPGWVQHGVMPVLEGERWALAVWGWGPRLR